MRPSAAEPSRSHSPPSFVIQDRAPIALLTAVLVISALTPIALLAVHPSALPVGHSTALPPAFGPRAAAPQPASTHVDPYALIQHEPAPMGIADFGVTAATGVVQAYSYATPVFQGNVEVDNMLTNDGGGTGYMTFQLNTVMVINSGTQNYSYWIQDIASIASSTKTIGWIDNIWNLSSPTAALATGEISGNGTVNNIYGTSWYADAPSGGAGNGVTLHYPANISIRSIISTINGYPHAAFTYNDGYGWVVFDNVTFNRAHGWTNYGFVVNGYTYTPLGIFYDAEWDYAGSGQGQHNIHSILNMSLVYWNGHNYASIPNAWNFGSDTAESLDNVISAWGAPRANGSLYSHVTNGSGTLGILYNASMVGTLSIASPSVPTGTILLNGSPFGFRGGSSLFTLAPGSYEVTLLNGSATVDSANVTVVAGQTTPLLLPEPRYGVSFQESGLPAGTAWSVNLAGTQLSSTASFANTTAKNGAYSYTIAGVAGYTTSSYHGAVTVTDQSVLVPVVFTAFTFTVDFTAYSLPSGTPWWIDFNGHTTEVTGGAATLTAPNGTFAYSVTTVNAYLANPGTGNVTVTGGPQSVDVEFVLHLGYLAGNVSPGNATVWVNGGPITLTGGEFNLSEVPGVYSIESAASGYMPWFDNVTVTPGNTSLVPITLTPAPPPPAGGSGGSGLSTTETIELVGATVLVVLAIGVAAFMLRRRGR